MYAELTAAMASLKVAGELALAAVSAQQRAKVQEALTEVNERLHKTSAAALASLEQVTTLRGRVQELEAENRRLRDWETEAQRYALREVAKGVFAYLEKDNVQPPQAAVKLCPTCYQRREKSVLQQQDVLVGRQLKLTCFACKFDVTFHRYLQTNEPPG